MPAIWTHMLFCEDIADTIRTVPNSVFANDTYMKLGSQGTNPLYFRHFWLGKRLPFKQCDLELQTNGTALIIDMIQEAKKMDDEAKAYIFGFITHFILLKHICPYMRYGAENITNSTDKMDIAIDTIMMEKFHNLKAWTSRVYKEIDVGFSINKDICTLLHRLFADHFPSFTRITDKKFQMAYREMKLTLRLLADPSGWKNKLFKHFFTPFSHELLDQGKDYLNLEHHAWHHPTTGKTSTDSFLDLYNRSRSTALEILSLVMHYWDQSNNALPTVLIQLFQQLTDIPADQSKNGPEFMAEVTGKSN
ncbi:hypothetical protein ACFSMW_01655 [Virgibacillus halophilus]|uniref:hypothetical protein n=1 Tax=Tigheibacillus halophilus TaxID=361280 RepID=UPI003625CD34